MKRILILSVLILTSIMSPTQRVDATAPNCRCKVITVTAQCNPKLAGTLLCAMATANPLTQEEKDCIIHGINLLGQLEVFLHNLPCNLFLDFPNPPISCKPEFKQDVIDVLVIMLSDPSISDDDKRALVQTYENLNEPGYCDFCDIMVEVLVRMTVSDIPVSSLCVIFSAIQDSYVNFPCIVCNWFKALTCIPSVNPANILGCLLDPSNAPCVYENIGGRVLDVLVCGCDAIPCLIADGLIWLVEILQGSAVSSVIPAFGETCPTGLMVLPQVAQCLCDKNKVFVLNKFLDSLTNTTIKTEILALPNIRACLSNPSGSFDCLEALYTIPCNGDEILSATVVRQLVIDRIGNVPEADLESCVCSIVERLSGSDYGCESFLCDVLTGIVKADAPLSHVIQLLVCIYDPAVNSDIAAVADEIVCCWFNQLLCEYRVVIPTLLACLLLNEYPSHVGDKVINALCCCQPHNDLFDKAITDALAQVFAAGGHLPTFGSCQ